MSWLAYECPLINHVLVHRDPKYNRPNYKMKVTNENIYCTQEYEHNIFTPLEFQMWVLKIRRTFQNLKENDLSKDK